MTHREEREDASSSSRPTAARDSTGTSSETTVASLPASPEAKTRAWWTWPGVVLVGISLALATVVMLRAAEERTATRLDGRDAAGIARGDVRGRTSTATPTATASQDPNVGADAARMRMPSEIETANTPIDGGLERIGIVANADAGDGDTGTLARALDDEGDGDAQVDAAASALLDGDTMVAATDAGRAAVIVGWGGAGDGGAPSLSTPRRSHFRFEAFHWRVSAGRERVIRTEERGDHFEVWLVPGGSFDGIVVEWQDKAGAWHTH